MADINTLKWEDVIGGVMCIVEDVHAKASLSHVRILIAKIVLPSAVIDVLIVDTSKEIIIDLRTGKNLNSRSFS